MARWLPPLRGTVAPSEAQQRCVMFVCCEIAGQITPIGTAVLVSIEHDGEIVSYFVTAKHVISHGQPTYVRLRRWDGQPPDDQPLGEWVSHASADVAMTPCEIDMTGYIANRQEDQFWCDRYPVGLTPYLGQDAYFMGLLADVPAMARRAIPMMRAAKVGALYVDDIPVKHRNALTSRDDRHDEPQAHLVDTYSRSGFSGSPVYVEYTQPSNVSLTLSFADLETGEKQVTAEPEWIQSYGLSALFGILVGHFGYGEQNTGVAVVVPIQALRELLGDQRLVEWRDRRVVFMKELREKAELDNAAVLDSVGPSGADDDRGDQGVSLAGADYEDVLRALLRTPPQGGRRSEDSGS